MTRILKVSKEELSGYWEEYWKTDLNDDQLETLTTVTYWFDNRFGINTLIKPVDWTNENDWKYATKDENGKIKIDKTVTMKDVTQQIRDYIHLLKKDLKDAEDLLKIAEEESQ